MANGSQEGRILFLTLHFYMGNFVSSINNEAKLLALRTKPKQRPRPQMQNATPFVCSVFPKKPFYLQHALNSFQQKKTQTKMKNAHNLSFLKNDAGGVAGNGFINTKKEILYRCAFCQNAWATGCFRSTENKRRKKDRRAKAEMMGIITISTWLFLPLQKPRR